MSNDEQMNQHEISVRDIIITILKGKFIIIAIIILAIIASSVVGFFFTPLLYEAKAVLLANPFNFDTSLAKEDTSSGIIDYLTKLPSMTIDTYINQLTSDDVLNATIKSLDLRDGNGKYLNSRDFAGLIKIENVAGTNLISIKVTSGSPDLAAQIANTLADNFINFVNTNTKKQGQQAVDLIAAQLMIEEENLNEKSQILADYRRNNRNIDVLRGEISSLVSQIVSFESTLNEIEKSITADTLALQTMWSMLKETPGIDLDDFSLIVNLDEQIDEQPDEQAGDNEQPSGNNDQLQISLSNDDLSVALFKIEFSKLQSRLIANTSTRDALQIKISDMNDMLTTDQITLAEEEYKYNAVYRDMQMAESSYDAYLQKYKEAQLTVAADIGKSSVMISSTALVPERPINTRIVFRIIVAAILGLIVGIVIVLFMDYWKKSKPA